MRLGSIFPNEGSLRREFERQSAIAVGRTQHCNALRLIQAQNKLYGTPYHEPKVTFRGMLLIWI